MTIIKQSFQRLPDGSIDIDSWLEKMGDLYPIKNNDLIKKAYHLSEVASKGLTTFYGQPCIEQSLEMAEIIFSLKLDQEAIATAIIISPIQQAHLSIETIQSQLSENVANLALGVQQMNIINNLAKIKTRDQTQIDRLRKTLLAMVSDIRVVIIKLAERMSLMRGIKNINPIERKRLAQETMDIYAPLANRLGIGQLKWELEDLAFHYTDPENYKLIAKFLVDRRADRESRIHETIVKLKKELAKANIIADLSGRAKHIYSIFLKMQHKHIDYRNIYDSSAIRILVPTLSDCYHALSIVHDFFEHIPEEFDDYISHPKSNGYRSIHTAVIGPDDKNLEIQIRTHDMHEEAEHGVAAHWLYKEKKTHPSGYEAKITYLRQLLAWHKEVAKEKSAPDKLREPLFEDRVYVFSPAGDILDLPVGATPLDFAYYIHSNLGHRCRGAKINGHIVSLTYTLQTGDQVEIITTKNGTPSRDWLNKEFGYLKTSRARAKVMQWFRQLEVTQYVESGKHLLEKELARAGIRPNLQKMATQFHLKDDDSLFAAIGHGTIRIAQVLQAAKHDSHFSTQATQPSHTKKIHPEPTRLQVTGVDDLMTRIARCCKPIPGDLIIGYITQGRGVSIHRKGCPNMRQIHSDQRFLDVSWDSKQLGNYYVDIQIRAIGKTDLLKEITTLLAHLKIDLITLNSTMSKKNSLLYVTMTVQIHDNTQLQQILNHIKSLPNVLDIKRIQQ